MKFQHVKHNLAIWEADQEEAHKQRGRMDTNLGWCQETRWRRRVMAEVDPMCIQQVLGFKPTLLTPMDRGFREYRHLITRRDSTHVNYGTLGKLLTFVNFSVLIYNMGELIISPSGIYMRAKHRRKSISWWSSSRNSKTGGKLKWKVHIPEIEKMVIEK